MTQERFPQSDEQAPQSEPAIVGFSENSKGIEQLAEVYSEPGMSINFQSHPYGKASERKAIIYTEGGTFYLKNNILYDINASLKDRVLDGVILDDKFDIPPITIGERSALSEDDEVVTQVIVATNKIDLVNSDQNHSLLISVQSRIEDPFRNMDMALEKLESKPKTTRRLRDTPQKANPITGEDEPVTFTVRAYDNANLLRNREDILPGVISVLEDEDLKRGKQETPLITSGHTDRVGRPRPISPQPIESFRKSYEGYRPRIIDEKILSLGGMFRSAFGVNARREKQQAIEIEAEADVKARKIMEEKKNNKEISEEEYENFIETQRAKYPSKKERRKL